MKNGPFLFGYGRMELLKWRSENQQHTSGVRPPTFEKKDGQPRVALGAAGEVEITGLKELMVALKETDAEIALEFRGGLIKAAEPVRDKAESLAVREIRNMGSKWSRMRIGVSARSGSVYIVPAMRRSRRGSPRPNLATLLLDRAMAPALALSTGEVYAEIELLLDRIAAQWNRRA